MTDIHYQIADHHTKSQLLSRGWTRAMVRDFLGAPDWTAPNPRHPRGAAMQLFATERVRQVEASAAFAPRLRLARERRERLRTVFHSRAEQLQARVAAWTVTPEIRPLLTVRREAADHHQLFDVDPATDLARLDALTVTFIRDTLTPYHMHLEALRGQVGVVKATQLLQRRTYAAIAQAYPDLQPECQRQASALGLEAFSHDAWPAAS